MVKTLQQHGNSHALVIEKPLMDAMGITPDAQLQITLSGNSMIVTPVNVGIGAKALASSMTKLRPRYGAMLRKLAE